MIMFLSTSMLSTMHDHVFRNMLDLYFDKTDFFVGTMPLFHSQTYC